LIRDPSTRSMFGIDGPYGSCAEDIFKYEEVVLIGAGIGVTPYASILKDVWHKLGDENYTYGTTGDLSSMFTLKKVHFFCICSTLDSFEWFGMLFQNLEEKTQKMALRQNTSLSFLNLNMYLTRGWSLREARQIVQNVTEQYDLFTGLRQKTNFGRPDFDAFFRNMVTSRNVGKKGVFFCGPGELSSELERLCHKYSDETIKFVYNKESF
jgi:hypothetical protein